MKTVFIPTSSSVRSMIVQHSRAEMKHVISLLLLLTWLSTSQATGEAYTNCTYPPLCQKRPPTTSRTVDETYHVPREPCSCHHTCHLYDYCCSDAPGHIYSSVERNILGRTDGDPWTCAYLVPVAVDPDSKPIFMVDWCPPKTNQLLHAKCTKDPSIAVFKYTYLLDVPVISSNSGLIYQNVFCGTCHKERYFREYDFNLSCDCEDATIQKVRSLNYEVGNLTWRGPKPQNIRCVHLDTITCHLLVNYTEEIGLRCEENLVDSCRNGEKFESYLNEGCVNGTNYYLQDEELNVYKNINCSLCNGKNLTEIFCQPPDEITSPTGVLGKDLWTISDLFSFDDHCDLNYVDDPVFDQCDMYENIADEIQNGTLGNDTSQNTTITWPASLEPSSASIFFVVMMSISIVCLFLHNIIFLILFKERNLHSMNLFSMTCSLFLANTFFIFGANLCDSHQSCYVLTIFVYYFYIAAFLWMNVMSVDICKTFHSQSIHSHKGMTFIKYSLYAWGLALMITFSALMVDNLASESPVSPKFACRGFWFGSIGGLLMFFVIPVEVLFCFNTALLLAAAKEIQKQKKMGKFASSSATSMRKLSKERSQKNNDDNDEEKKIYKLITGKVKKTLSDHKNQVAKLKLYACLAVLMGVTWIFAVLVNFSVVFEYLFNFINSLQGVFVFLAFDCKRKVWANVKAAFSSSSSPTAYSMSKSTESDQASLSSSRSNSTGGRKRGPKKTRGQSSASKTTIDTVISKEPDLDVEGRNDAYRKEDEVKRTNVEPEVYDIGELNVDSFETDPAHYHPASRNIYLSPSNIVAQDVPISYDAATSTNMQYIEDSDREQPLMGMPDDRNLPTRMHSQELGSPEGISSTARYEESVERSPAVRSSFIHSRDMPTQVEAATPDRYSDSSDERFVDASRSKPPRSRRKRRSRKKRDRTETSGGSPQTWKMNYSMKRAIESSEEEDIIDV